MTLPIHPELGSDFDYSEALRDLTNAVNGLHPAPAAVDISKQVIQLGALLLKKNAAYGDAALQPLEVFATGLPTSVRLGVRMDDKISRMARGSADGEDPQMDLAGYLMLLRIALARESQERVAQLYVGEPDSRSRPTPYPAVDASEAVPANA